MEVTIIKHLHAWKPKRTSLDPKFAPSGTTDEDFVIHDGTVIHGHHEMVWHSEKKWATSLGSITLPRDYPMHWEHYSDAEDHKGDFKYVMTEITK